ncbi:YgiW/YdeI family stress tolerance OB fold protein [Thorsellia anophelis]|uniref:TIGR00156 family protein n=1 Tax=Thorsellia anophelis DSM 18579 TaxID=1123402 RepID=A0A1I0EU90_9GAMM|nr:NirD/YgiW/YdeI family stress tolerance protein [Thorsellia anophelis]SET48969.1 TIGR00156 family protein [Thorsellia anophelis DSM 18579]
MKNTNLFFYCLISLAIVTCNVHADFVGKNGTQSTPYDTVKSIVANPIEDKQVSLIGNIIEKIGHEKYLFTDGTQTIRLDIDDEKFPIEPVDESTTVKIYGEIDKEFLESPEIDVDFIQIVK